MFKKLLLLFLTTATHAVADSSRAYYSDGFGILPKNKLSQARAAWAGLYRTENHNQITQPSTADIVQIYLGGKALIAGKSKGHAVALVKDKWGNLIRNNTPSRIVIDGKYYDDVPTHNGIADIIFTAPEKSGQFIAGVTVNQRQSPRAVYRIVADLDSVSPSVIPPLQGQVEIVQTIKSLPLRDKFGNLVEDGMASDFLISHSDASYSLMTAPVVQGRSIARYLARDVSSAGQITPSIASKTSLSVPINVDRPRPLGPIDIQLKSDALNEAFNLRIGPFISTSGHMLNDGSLVKVDIQNTSGSVVHLEGWIKDGLFETMVALPNGSDFFQFQVSSLFGTQKSRFKPSTFASKQKQKEQ